MEKTERFGLVLTPAELAALQRLADSDGGLSSAAVIRRLIRQEAQRRGVWPDLVDGTTPKVVEVQHG